jgi:hypothetical protein
VDLRIAGRLTSAQVYAAAEDAKVYPTSGRPLTAHSLKRMLSDMASSGVWDVDNDGETIEPRPIP